MIFIFSAESAPEGEREERGGSWRRTKTQGSVGRGQGGRGWLLVVVGRASKAVVQTSGTMEATLVF